MSATSFAGNRAKAGELCCGLADQGIMDPDHEMSSGSTDPSSGDHQLKRCTGCRTTKTPLWRAGPTGPKSLCNACGIRYRKNVKEAGTKVKNAKREIVGGGKGASFGFSLKLQMSGLGLWKQRSMVQKQSRRRMLGEEEKAAVLLMALSYGFL